MVSRPFQLLICVAMMLASRPGFADPANADAERDLAAVLDKARNDLQSKARALKATISDAMGTKFKDQVEEALSTLAKDGATTNQQIKTIDLILPWAGSIKKALDDVKASNLGEARDRVVTVYNALAADKEKEAVKYMKTSEASKDPEWKARYEALSKACTRMSRAYKADAEWYAKMDISTHVLWVANASEWLGEVQSVLKGLRVNLVLLEDVATLEELRAFSVSVAGIQDAISRFSATVEQTAYGRQAPPTKPESSEKKPS